jgi:hypothetical protein
VVALSNLVSLPLVSVKDEFIISTPLVAIHVDDMVSTIMIAYVIVTGINSLWRVCYEM